jgi:hypothetical protein
MRGSRGLPLPDAADPVTDAVTLCVRCTMVVVCACVCVLCDDDDIDVCVCLCACACVCVCVRVCCVSAWPVLRVRVCAVSMSLAQTETVRLVAV